ncbi:MAG: TIGR00730 family Rossman fold protein [Gemmatimonadetes bacterium]|nr:TIGR00730 family Rossman fold protein [Pseudomonadales bacterium]NIW37445.1 TIGR00730 family Rossman fold protein [Gemmatimonadota bacterium]NIX08225.1 TIGR00730 family Rossman fold protein [Pseudomonadales bacterium]
MEKAYKNLAFLNSRDARTIRILAEYLEPQARFARYNVTDTVVFFGSARALPPDDAATQLEEAEASGDARQRELAQQAVRLGRYYDEARELASLLTSWSKGLELPSRRFIVCSGGGPGIMEAANRGASEAAGISIGLGISLPMEATANPYITRELGFEFHYFFTRKFWFVYLAKALVVFPGGFGTLDELFELLTLIQTQKVDRPVPVVLYGKEFWSDVLNFDTLVKWGTISKEDLKLFHVASTPQDAFEHLRDELTRLYLEPEKRGS